MNGLKYKVQFTRWWRLFVTLPVICILLSVNGYKAIGAISRSGDTANIIDGTAVQIITPDNADDLTLVAELHFPTVPGQDEDVRYRQFIVSPDDQTLAIHVTEHRGAMRRATIELWDIATLTVRHRIVPWIDIYPSIVFSPDSRYLLTTEASIMQLWDVQTKEEVQVWTPIVRFRYATFNNDGTLLAFADGRVGEEYQVTVWDMVNQQELATTIVDDVNVLAFDNNSDELAISVGLGEFYLWNWNDSEPRHWFTLPERSRVTRMIFTPDSALMVFDGQTTPNHEWFVGVVDVAQAEIVTYVNALSAPHIPMRLLAYRSDAIYLVDIQMDAVVQMFNEFALVDVNTAETLIITSDNATYDTLRSIASREIMYTWEAPNPFDVARRFSPQDTFIFNFNLSDDFIIEFWAVPVSGE